MKKMMFCLFVMIFLSPHLVFAQPSNYVEFGVNYSSFRTEGGKSEPGLTIGFGKNYYPIQNFNGFFGFDVRYVRKRILLENKRWPSGFDPSNADLMIGDIKSDISFLDLPIRFGYSVQIRKSFNISLQTGASLSIPIKNHTKLKSLKIIQLGSEERGSVEFDYILWDIHGVKGSIDLQYSIALIFRSAVLRFFYSHALTATEGFTDLMISDKLDSFHISFGYVF